MQKNEFIGLFFKNGYLMIQVQRDNATVGGCKEVQEKAVLCTCGWIVELSLRGKSFIVMK